MLWLLALVPMLAGGALFGVGLQRRSALAVTACLTLSVTLLLALLAAMSGWTGGLEWSAALRLQAALTPLSAVMAVLVPAVALPVLAFAAFHEYRTGLSRLIALLLFFVGAMELLVIASDLLTLLIGWELVGACSWALIGHHWRDPDNPRSGQYAFIVTRFGDLGMFAAAMAAFAGTGSFAFADLAQLQGSLLQLLVFGLLLSAASKSGQLPFSPWLFRAMAGPTSVSALLHAATMVAAGAYLLARLQPELDRVSWFAPTAITIGLATALTGGIAAVLQSHAKKMLAASTSAHFGLMFVTVGAGYPGVAILHLVAHACFKALLFLSAGIAGERVGSFTLARMRVGRALPLIALMAGVGSLSLAGVPPLGGAWTKEAIVAAAGHVAFWLGIGAFLAGGLSAAYAARFQWLAFGFAADSAPGDNPHAAELAALALLALANIALSILWLPRVSHAIAVGLKIEMPATSTWEWAASLLTVAVGLLAGRFLALRYPQLGQITLAAGVADWFALPVLVRKAVTEPSQALARALARFDDGVIDAVSRGVPALARGAASIVARDDRRVVDGGVRLTVAIAQGLAGASSRVGELLLDGLPEGTARLIGFGGEEARRLQSGLSHQYFALLITGVVLLTAILFMAT